MSLRKMIDTAHTQQDDGIKSLGNVLAAALIRFLYFNISVNSNKQVLIWHRLSAVLHSCVLTLIGSFVSVDTSQ